MNGPRTALIALLFVPGGCTVGPAYRAPPVSVPAAYGVGAPVPAEDPGQWWRAFDDPVLDDLIARARSGNLDVQQAAARVEQARAQERVTRASGGPSVNVSGQAGYTRLSENSLPSALANLGGASPGQPSTGSGLGLPGEGFTTFQTGFDASWELDLFGGQRRAEEAAGARTEASVWSQRDAEVMLAAEVANTYQQYRAIQRRIVLADAMIASQRELIDFVRVRAANGLTNTIDERHQQQQLEQLAAQREDLAAQAKTFVHALGTLLGLEPDALSARLAAHAATAPAPVDVPAGLPSELLQRRPDIRAAERRLAAATADIGVATADLYPKISLTGAVQLASRALASLLEPDSLLANSAGRVSMPLLGGAGRATVGLRQAQADEALLAYRSSVLTALRDVEDALTRLEADRRRAEHMRLALGQSEDAADTAAVRYRNGLVTFIEVLQARQAVLTARDAVTQAETAAIQDEVALYKALGGGWDNRRDPSEEEPASG